jgi:hypothetical protein
MKSKLIILTMLFALSHLANADTSFTWAPGHQTDNTTHAVTDSNLYVLKSDVTNNLAADIFVLNKESNQTQLVTNRTELGLTGSVWISDFKPYVRVSAGERQVSGTNSVPYYSVEPGLTVKLPGKFYVSGSFYYRNAFQPNNQDWVNEYRGALGYEVTSKDKIAIGAFRDVAGNKLASTNYISLTHSF